METLSELDKGCACMTLHEKRAPEIVVFCNNTKVVSVHLDMI